MNIILIKKFSELSGYSENAIRMKIKRGIWIQNKHYRRDPQNRIWIIIDAVEKWIFAGCEGDKL